MCKHPRSLQEDHEHTTDRRGFLKTGVGSAVAVAALAGANRLATAAEDPYADPAEPALPPSDMVLDTGRAALVVSDPQVDFLSPDGVTWGVVGESVTQAATGMADATAKGLEDLSETLRTRGEEFRARIDPDKESGDDSA